MLLVTPTALFSVGFQLSVACVAGLLVFTPALQALLTPSTWVGKQLWLAVCATLAAQAGALPLVLFHFGQFPVWFWLANPPAVVLASFLLAAEFVFLISAGFFALLSLDFSLSFLVYPIQAGIKMLNAWIEAVAALPAALQEGLYVSGGQALVLAALLIWLSSLKGKAPLPLARQAVVLGVLWATASCADLTIRAGSTANALGYNQTTSSYYWVCRQGLSTTIVGAPTADATRLAMLWRTTVCRVVPYQENRVPLVLMGTLMAPYKLPYNQKPKSEIPVYDLSREVYFVCN
jgi:predicted membrane metal-binding protein